MIFRAFLFTTFLLPAIEAHSSVTFETGSSSLEAISNAGSGFRFSGELGMDSSSFLYSSDSRGTSSTTVQATLNAKRDFSVFHTESNLSLYAFINSQPLSLIHI